MNTACFHYGRTKAGKVKDWIFQRQRNPSHWISLRLLCKLEYHLTCSNHYLFQLAFALRPLFLLWQPFKSNVFYLASNILIAKKKNLKVISKFFPRIYTPEKHLFPFDKTMIKCTFLNVLTIYLTNQPNNQTNVTNSLTITKLCSCSIQIKLKCCEFLQTVGGANYI